MRNRLLLLAAELRIAAKRDPHAYHVTYHNRLPDIARQGLQPNKRRNIGGPAYDKHSKDKLFFTDAQGVRFWHNRSSDHAEHNSDNVAKDRMVPVVLRVPRNQINKPTNDKPGTEDARARSFTTKHPIDPQHVQVWNGKEWTHISNHETVNHLDGLDEAEDGHYFKSKSPLHPEFDD